MDVWGLLAILLLGGICAWAARRLALQGRLGSDLRKLAAAFFVKPSDYFTPLQTSRLDLSRESFRMTMKVKHKYAGKYWVEISVPQPVPNGVKSYEAGFKLLLEFFVDGNPTLQKRVFGIAAPWWTHSANGFTLTTYAVPDDAPLKHEVEMVVTVEKADAEFERRYGAATFFVGKASEK